MPDHPQRGGLHEQLNDPRFRALTEHAQELIGVLDGALCLRYASPGVERVLGYEPHELHGVIVHELAHPEDLPEVQAALARLLASPGLTLTLSARGRHKNGSYRHFDVVAHNLLHDPAIAAIVINARDVSEQRETLLALAESERRFRMLAENARDIVARYRLWPSAGLEYVSPSVGRVLGYAPSELYGSPDAFLALIDPEHRERLILLMADPERPENAALQTLCWRRKDGQRVFMEHQAVFVRDASGRIIAAEVIARDVSEKIRLAEELQQARRREAIGSLGAGIAHDLNNMLMAIFGHLSRLEAQLPKRGPALESLSAIRDSARRAAGLADQLLSFARKGTRSPVAVDLSQAIERFELALRRSLPPDVKLCIERKARDYFVVCDPSQLDQLLNNLAQNARDAMPGGGTLTLRVGDGADGRMRLEVEDTGPGIAEHELGRVFEPFVPMRDGASSSGLGLAAVQRIVESLAGMVTVRSAAGAGTCFTVELPTTKALPSARARGAAVLRQTGDASYGRRERAATVLLVDDQRTVREVLGQLLRDAGYRVLEAENGARALACAEREPISILVTDIVMPDLDGPALLERLRARNPGLPAVCISGYAGDEIDPRAAPNRITSFLAKPFAPEALIECLEQLLYAAAQPAAFE